MYLTDWYEKQRYNVSVLSRDPVTLDYVIL